MFYDEIQAFLSAARKLRYTLAYYKLGDPLRQLKLDLIDLIIRELSHPSSMSHIHFVYTVQFETSPEVLETALHELFSEMHIIVDMIIVRPRHSTSYDCFITID